MTSTHRRFPGSVEVENGNLIVNGKKIRISAERDSQKTLHGVNVGADYILESTGFFLTDETARSHIVAWIDQCALS